MFRPKIGLALGGGGPKGLAHIGVIKALEKNNIPIDFIAGTSVGSLIGGFYAYSKNIATIEEYLMKKNWLQILSYFADPSIRGGLIEGNKMERFLDEYLYSSSFSDVKIPFHATSIDIQTGDLVNLNSGSLSRAIRASCAVPILFKPVEISDHFYLDGGLISSVPVETVRKMGADIIIAVQLNKHFKSHEDIRSLSIQEIGEIALQIVEGNIAKNEVKRANYIICPSVAHIRWHHLLQPNKKEEGIRLGEEAALKIIPSIKLILGKNKIELSLHNWIEKIKKLF